MASKYDRFKLVTDFELLGDQRRAIEELVQGLERGDQSQVLLGVTGSRQDVHDGAVHRAGEPARRWSWRTTRRWPRSSTRSSRRFFPENAVEYFVSYYDYYQPEAYVPPADTYIEKEATINDEIDRMRLSRDALACSSGATSSSSPACRASTASARPRRTTA